MHLSWEIHRIVLEIRFTNGFLYWDKTGSIIKRLIEARPKFEVEEASPREAILRDPEGDTIALSVERASVTCQVHHRNKADAINEFLATCKAIAEITFKDFEIRTINRLGNRIHYAWDAGSTDTAIETLEKIAVAHKFGGDFSSDAGDPLLKDKRVKEVSARFENDKRGFSLTLKPIKVSVDVRGTHSKEFLAKLPPPKPYLLCDTDIYTVGLLPVSQVLVEEYVRSNLKFVEKRILDSFSFV